MLYLISCPLSHVQPTISGASIPLQSVTVMLHFGTSVFLCLSLHMLLSVAGLADDWVLEYATFGCLIRSSIIKSLTISIHLLELLLPLVDSILLLYAFAVGQSGFILAKK